MFELALEVGGDGDSDAGDSDGGELGAASVCVACAVDVGAADAAAGRDDGATPPPYSSLISRSSRSEYSP